MIELTFINKRGDSLDLINNEYFIITNIEGMTAFNSSVSSNVIGAVDGDSITNIQGQPRGIILDLTVRPDADVEEAKRYILRTVKPKQEARIVWRQNDRDIEIYGVVEGVEMPRWTEGIVMQVSLHCEQPFWEDVEAIIETIGKAKSLHYFMEDIQEMLYFPSTGIPLGEIDIYRSKSVFNDGDASVGLEIIINAIDVVTNPIIYNADNDFLGFGYGDGTKQLVLQPGDTLLITTGKGFKSATLDGVSVINKIKPGSKWHQLEPGDNTFSINSDDQSIFNMYFGISYKRRYV